MSDDINTIEISSSDDNSGNDRLETQESFSSDRSVVLIGLPKVGKTTYLGTLFHYFENSSNSYDIRIETIDQKAKNLKEDIRNSLPTGTSINASSGITDCTFRIHLSGKLASRLSRREITIAVSDYAGELFKNLDEENFSDDAKQNFKRCFSSNKWLLLLNDWEPNSDRKSKIRIESLLNQVSTKDRKSLRVAVVISKCERGELWTGRREPEEDIFAVYLPDTYRYLKSFFESNPRHLNFFACSSFGVLGDKQPLPNRYNHDRDNSDHRISILRDPHKWRPYGLITPFIWLNTLVHWRDDRI